MEPEEKKLSEGEAAEEKTAPEEEIVVLEEEPEALDEDTAAPEEEPAALEKESAEPEEEPAAPEEDTVEPEEEFAAPQRPRPRSRRRKPRKAFPWKRAAVICAAVLLAAGGLFAAGAVYYVHEGEQYKTVFFPNTYVNGIDVSNMTVDEVKELVASRIGDYTLTITGRGGEREIITGDQVGYRYVFDGSLEKYLSGQDPMDWWNHRKKTTEYQIDTLITIDEEMLAARVEELSFLDEEKFVEPQDARLTEFVPGQGVSIIPEQLGSALDCDAVREAVTEAVLALRTELSLEDLDVYRKPAVTSDDPQLKAEAEAINRFLDLSVTYQFGDVTHVLDSATILSWITFGDDGQVTLDQEQVAAYVAALATLYDTAGKSKTLKTSYGDVVTVPGGTYGWRIDQAAETESLCGIILSGESQTREPIYRQRAASHGENDYGNTYVEINLSAQRLFFYKDGKLYVETDLVSGNHAKGYDTPAGAYFINYKQKDAVLRGERRSNGSYEYESPVSFWMPFNGGIGLHDASWRASFGGKIYLTNGSHGCVNLPYSAAKTIFEQISAGDAVLCYQLEVEPEPASGSASGAAQGAGATSAEKPSQGAENESSAADTQPDVSAQPDSGQPGPEEETPHPVEEPSPSGGTDFSGGPGAQGSSSGPGAAGNSPAGPGSTDLSGGPGAQGSSSGTGGPGGSSSGPGGSPGGPGSADFSGGPGVQGSSSGSGGPGVWGSSSEPDGPGIWERICSVSPRHGNESDQN